MNLLKLGNTRLACVDQGQGETVVLVHGSNSDVRTWESVRDNLSRHHRVFAYSRRYHWPNESIALGADYAMQQQLDDLVAAVASLGVGAVHLVGHSYGALLCLQLALQAQGSVRSLVLSEPPSIRLFTSIPPTLLELLALSLRRPRTAWAIANFGLRGVVPATAALKRGAPDAALEHIGRAVLGSAAFARLSPERLSQARQNLIPAELMGSGMAPLDATAIRRLAVPTLLLRGEHSPALFGHLMDRLAQLLPDARCTEIAGASHIAHEDNPQAWLAAVQAFLRRSLPVQQATARAAPVQLQKSS